MAKKIKKKPLIQKPISLKNYIIEAARKLPIYKCMTLGDADGGMMQIAVGRRKHNGKIIIGFYLIDLYCLGLKDTFYSEFDNSDDFDEKVESMGFGDTKFVDVEPNLAFNYIYGAIEYAEDIAFKPHKDFAITEYILDDVEKIEFVDIEFGYKGKPYFIAGENDKAGVILAHLDKHVGVGNYEYTININEEYENDDDDDENESEGDVFDLDYDEELEEFRNMEGDEFENHLQEIIENLPKNEKPNYLLVMKFAMTCNLLYEDYDKLFQEYRKNSLSVFTKLKNHFKKDPTQLTVKEIEGNNPLVQIAVENYLQFEGPEFLCLNDFIKTIKVFEIGEEQINEKDANFYIKFLISFEERRKLNLSLLLQLVTTNLLDDEDYFDLNVFQRNIIANKLLELLDQFGTGLEIDEEWDFLLEYLFKHSELSEYLPEISDKELQKLMVNLSLPQKS